MHLLIGLDIRRFHQFGVERNTALIPQIGLSHGCLMNFGFNKNPGHWVVSPSILKSVVELVYQSNGKTFFYQQPQGFFTTKGTKYTMPTFNKAFKEVGIVPISIICFMENRHKNDEKQIFLVKALPQRLLPSLVPLVNLVVKDVSNNDVVYQPHFINKCRQGQHRSFFYTLYRFERF